MTRVGLVTDKVSYVGGAELTAQAWVRSAPEGVEIVPCPVGQVEDDCDVYVVGNCVTYPLSALKPLDGRVVKYWNDTGPWVKPEVREFLDRQVQVCCSPLQADHMRLKAHVIPPPVDINRFAEAAASMNGSRAGLVSVGCWHNPAKAPHRVLEWANGEPVAFYGNGVCAPTTSTWVDPKELPQVLAKYRTFVFLPTMIEPFGRVVVEAWAAGCEIVINNLVGAQWWIREHPDKLLTAAEDFWGLVLEHA